MTDPRDEIEQAIEQVALEIAEEVGSWFCGPPRSCPQCRKVIAGQLKHKLERVVSALLRRRSGETDGRVWMVESGDYEERGVVGLYTTLDAAIAGIKATYGRPYRVQWTEKRYGSDECELTGHFDAVPGYSTQHAEAFDIAPHVVHSPKDSGEIPEPDSHTNEGHKTKSI